MKPKQKKIVDKERKKTLKNVKKRCSLFKKNVLKELKNMQVCKAKGGYTQITLRRKNEKTTYKKRLLKRNTCIPQRNAYTKMTTRCCHCKHTANSKNMSPIFAN